MATQRGAAWKIHVSSCEPPSDQPQEACLPPQQERRRCLRRGGTCSRNACATAAQHARPSRAGRQRLPAHRASRSASCRAACRPFGRASASTAANAGAEGALSPPHMLPRLGPLFALVRVGGRIKRPTGRGGMAVRPRTPRGTAMSLDPCLQCTASARRERSSAIETKGLATKASV